jgi:hypothetical protein
MKTLTWRQLLEGIQQMAADDESLLDQPVLAMYDTSQILSLNALDIADHYNCYGGCDGTDNEVSEGTMVMFMDLEEGTWYGPTLWWDTDS